MHEAITTWALRVKCLVCGANAQQACTALDVHPSRIVEGLGAALVALQIENDALSKVYRTAASLRVMPVPFADYIRLMDTVNECRQVLSEERPSEEARLRALVVEACGELEDTGGDFAKQRAAEILQELGKMDDLYTSI